MRNRHSHFLSRPGVFLALFFCVALLGVSGVMSAQDDPPTFQPEAAVFAADAGDLDPDFGGFAGDGRIEFDDMEVLEFAQHGDNGWVVLGRRSEELLVRRFTYDGALDTNFGQGGTAIFKTNDNPCAFLAEDRFEECGIAVQSNGGIIVVGATKVGGDTDFLVYRLHANGQLDTAFGQNGSRTIDFDDGDDRAYAVAIQNDDRIVVSGLMTDPDPIATDDQEFATVRLTTGGDLDNSFSGDGMASTSFGGNIASQWSFATSVAIQPADGRIVVGGEADDSGAAGGPFTDFDFGLLRYDSAGMLDQSFHNDGKVNTGFGGYHDYVTALFIQPDGRIIAAGVEDEPLGFAIGEGDMALARYNTNGTLDDTFGNQGRVHTPIGPWSKAAAVTGQPKPNGKVLVAGISDGDTILARYEADGSPDSSFSDDGNRIMLTGQGGRDIALQPDDKVLIASGAISGVGSLTRYQTNLLLLDRSGSNTTGFGYGPDRAYGVERTPNGDYIVAVESQSPLSSNGLDVALVRYTATGHLDRSFGENGRAEFSAINDDSARAMAVQPDGKIVIAGFRFDTINEDFALWRFNADGSVDSSFGGDGLARGFFGLGPDYGQDLVVQSDGKIVIAGFSETNNGRYLTMTRFDENGDRDDSFGDQGNGRFVQAMGSDYFSLRALTEMPDGDLLAVGGHSGDFWAYRFTADGVPDPAFSNDGYMEYALSGNDEAHAVEVLPSGLIAIGGYSGGDFGLLLVLDDGSMCLEPCGLTVESRIRIDMGGDEGAYDLAIQSNGKIVLVGAPRFISNQPGPLYVARVHRSTFPVLAYGIDPSFGTAGIAGVPLIHGSRVHDVLLHHDRIVLAGQTGNGVDDDIILARLLNDHGDPLPPPTNPPPPPPQGEILLPVVLRR